MIRRSTIQQIKIRQAAGHSISAMAQDLGIDRKTGRTYWQQTDVSRPATAGERRPSQLDPYKAPLDPWLAEDRPHGYQQRHTSHRIFDRRPEAVPEFPGSYRTVRRYGHPQRQVAPTTGTLDLLWHPGDAPVDFGQADVREHRDVVRMHFLCVPVPYRNAGYRQLFRGANAACVVPGLVAIVHHIGSAPGRLGFDNARGGGRRTGATIRMPALCQRCQAHYGFATTFCNPAAGYDKGKVAHKVGGVRRNLLVPLLAVPDRVATTAALLRPSEAPGGRRPYTTGQPVQDLFAADRAALRALPPPAVAPYRYTQVRTDRQGRFWLARHPG
jgi:transposase